VRDRALHDQLRAFAEGAREHLAERLEGGAEIAFEVAETPGATSVLYHYRPLSGDFVRDGFDEISELEGFGPAVLALSELKGGAAYLRALGAGEPPVSEHEQAEAVLREFLARLWDEVTVFELDDQRFQRAYAEFESIVYDGRFLAVVVAPLLGVRLADERWDLGGGVALARGDLCEAPPEAVWAGGHEEREPSTLAVLTVEATPQDPPPLTGARLAFRKLLTAVRLFKRGPVAFGPTAWWRIDDGPWQSVPLASSGRPRAGQLWLEPSDRGELAELFRLVRSRPLDRGPVAWALARFEMGCERALPTEGLSDDLLALSALLHDDAPGMSSRVAALCAEAPRRRELQERVEQAFRLQRVLMRGGLDADYLEATGSDPPDAVALDLEDHLRAILRDIVCGYLDADVKRIADELLLAEESGSADSESKPELVVRRSSEGEAVEPAQPASGQASAPPATGTSTEEQSAVDTDTETEQATEETVAVARTREISGDDDTSDWDFDDDPSDYSAAI
jgi:hypothetical protein